MSDAGEAARRERILRFWRSVELFGTQKLDPPNARERRYQIRPGQLLPWQSGHPLRRQPLREGQVWRHTVYGGVFSLDRLHASLERVFGPSGPDVDERTPRGESALFAVIVTDDRRLLLDSLVLSTAAWAVGRAHQPGPAAADWLDGFDEAAKEFTTAVRGAVAADDDDGPAAKLADDGIAVSRPVIDADLVDLAERAIETLGVAEALAPAGLRVHSERVGRKREHDARVDFLNSFYVGDLERIADAVAEDDCGPALAAFLTPEDELATRFRLDVRDPGREERLLDQLAPTRVPAGRWPQKPSYPLAASQQLAINAIMERLGGHAGVFGVNGPPGTGKTTMLRDLVAAVVVERARRLVELPTPAAGFGEEVLAWRSDNYRRRIRPLRPELTGFEMVVASANNGAVANVTKEIPQRQAIDDSWVDQADYFAGHATRVLGEPGWGLVAARLGNRANCGEFVGRFWYGQPADPTKQPGDEGTGFQEWLGEAEVATTPPGWTAAVSTFRAAVAAEQQLRETRQAAYQALRSIPELEQAFLAAQARQERMQEDHHAADAEARAATQTATNAHQSAHVARERRREHRSVKPGVWEILFTLGRAIRRWIAEDELLATAAIAAETGATAAAALADAARHKAEAAAQQVAAATAGVDRAAHTLTEARRTVAAASQEWGHCVPDAGWRHDATRRELAGPWLDEQWNSARTQVFLAALDLHAAFIAGAAKAIRANLRAAMDVLNGQLPPDVPQSSVRQAWQSLFLVIPVVSTTFASVDRLLGRLGREDLGWLLIDEAGQAPPQAATGAIWRAKRVVAVGDPLQLEPVVTVLHTTQAALGRHHDVDPAWLPGHTTVQEQADRVTGIGTWLPGPDDTMAWVGAPLRVHRRCDNPMFEVVNTAVYGGLMIHGTSPRQDPLTVVESAWIDVRATEADGHWIPAEGDATLEIIRYLFRCGADPARTMAISPFRDTARRLRSLLAGAYPQLTCGTVHTAQGKEADVVLLVLGGNPTKPGARQWAASRPNLFNVAVSRAKQRLYVVGNHDHWARLRYFATLARALPVRPLRNPPAV